MFMKVIVIFKVVDASLFIKWEPGSILRLFKPSVKYVKYHRTYLSLLFFISVVRMVLQSYTYMT